MTEKVTEVFPNYVLEPNRAVNITTPNIFAGSPAHYIRVQRNGDNLQAVLCVRKDRSAAWEETILCSGSHIRSHPVAATPPATTPTCVECGGFPGSNPRAHWKAMGPGYWEHRCANLHPSVPPTFIGVPRDTSVRRLPPDEERKFTDGRQHTALTAEDWSNAYGAKTATEAAILHDAAQQRLDDAVARENARQAQPDSSDTTNTHSSHIHYNALVVGKVYNTNRFAGGAYFFSREGNAIRLWRGGPNTLTGLGQTLGEAVADLLYSEQVAFFGKQVGFQPPAKPAEPVRVEFEDKPKPAEAAKAASLDPLDTLNPSLVKEVEAYIIRNAGRDQNVVQAEILRILSDVFIDRAHLKGTFAPKGRTKFEAAAESK